ncbi:MAG TPA: YceI family protein [Steroidobacteraceae bacterium]|nr:YceI family protein [Steroidobacteraceae bacterium]
MFNRIAIAVAVVSLAACAAPRPRPITRPPPVQAVLQSLPVAGEYPIDSSGSEVRLLVYRAGPLSNLGHNHVMVNRAVTGRVQIGADVPASSFSLSLRAEDFVIDDAQARQEEGGDFPGDIAEDAKAGTRRNLLSDAVLNAAEFPDITVKSVSLAGTLSELNADLEVGAAGHTSRVSVPLSLQDDAHGFTALGSVELRQTALGLIPYSLLHGALQVQDAMQLKFRIKVLTN